MDRRRPRRGEKARRHVTPGPRCPRGAACRCRHGWASWRTSSAIATSPWASRSTWASVVATPAPRTSLPQAIRDTVRAAYDIARFTAEDEFAGLPDAGRPSAGCGGTPRTGPVPPVGHRCLRRPPKLRCAARPRRCRVDKRITNSEGRGRVGPAVALLDGQHARASRGGYASSRHSLSVAPIAGRGAGMQRDAWYSSMRDPQPTWPLPEAIGRYAAERALSRLKARKVGHRRDPRAV